jgi:hypothetical protein
MLEVSHDAAARGEEKLFSCAAYHSKYCFICTVTLGPCCDLPLTSLDRWQCICGGADTCLNSFKAGCGCGKEYPCGVLPEETCGYMLQAMARIAPSQPKEAMARIAPRSPVVPMTNNKKSP